MRNGSSRLLPRLWYSLGPLLGTKIDRTHFAPCMTHMRRSVLLFLCLLALGAATQGQAIRSASTRVTAAAAGTQLAQVTLSPGYQSSNPGVVASVAALTGPASGTGPIPTGSITFIDHYDNGTTQISDPVSLNAGQVTDGWNTLAVGSHSISGQYSGDSNYAPVTSSPVTILVQKFTPALTLAVSTSTPSIGGAFTATATISSSQLTSPTGSVTFTLDNNTVGIATLNGANPTYTATQTITIATGGTHSIGATYSGDANYASAAASPVSVSTGKGATVTSLSATPTTLTAGTAETLTASIAPATATSGTNTITGTVTFYDGATALANPVTVASNQAVLTGVNLTATASHSVTAVYSGDTNWLGSTSSPVVLSSAGAASSVTLTVSSPVALAGTVVTFTATAAGSATTSSGNPLMPTGMVTFYDGTTSIGEASLQNVSGKATATLDTSTLSGGSHQITAHYAGDTNFKAAVSSAVTIAIEAFSITPSVTNLTLRQGESGAITYTVAAAAGISAAVQFGCNPPANTFTTCTFAPTAVTGNGQTTLTIATSSPNGTSANLRGLRLFTAQGSALACVLLCCTSFGARFRRSIGPRWFLMLPLLLFGIALIGCSGGSSSHLSQSTPTPAGTQVFEVITSTTVNGQTVEQDTYIDVDVLPAS